MHRLTEIDPDRRTAVCEVCGPVGIRRQGRGGGWRCRIKANQHKRSPGEKPRTKRKRTTSPHRRFLKGACERCGFVPIHPCQMDVHHKDEDHDNNDPENLETLCACCHRLAHHTGQL